MKMQIHKHTMLLFGLLLLSFCVQAQDEGSTNKGLFADKPKKLMIELKAGRGFLSNMSGEASGEGRVFVGGGGMSFGVMLRNTFLGLGVNAEYVDMTEGSFDFPVFLNAQHFFKNETNKGFFVGAKAGYIFGGNKSMPVLITVEEEEVNANINRSMKGPYGEVNVGYRLNGVNIFVSYNYRVIHYETTLYSNSLHYNSPYSSTYRSMHAVMLGFSFMLL